MAYWLFKTDPEDYAFDDLWNAPARTTAWGGVRNYQARNFLRDQVKVGDGVLIHHTGTNAGIVGTARVVGAAAPDPTAFDRGSPGFDPKSTPAAPIWYQVEIQAEARIDPPLGLAALREVPELSKMELLRRGSRLSVQPVTAAEWRAVSKLAKAKGRGQ